MTGHHQDRNTGAAGDPQRPVEENLFGGASGGFLASCAVPPLFLLKMHD